MKPVADLALLKELQRVRAARIEALRSLEEIPKALASNSGKNPIDALTWLRAGHSAGSKDLCIEVGTDAAKAVDVFLVKRHAINAASDVATMVLGISDVIAVTNPAAVQAAQREAEAEQNRIQGSGCGRHSRRTRRSRRSKQ
jgi:chaperonin GroEL (HSP60 family)